MNGAPVCVDLRIIGLLIVSALAIWALVVFGAMWYES